MIDRVGGPVRCHPPCHPLWISWFVTIPSYNRNNKYDYSSLLEQGNECTFHVKNLQALVTEIYNTIVDLNPTFFNEISVREYTPYSLKCSLWLKIPSVRTLSYGSLSKVVTSGIHYQTYRVE